MEWPTAIKREKTERRRENKLPKRVTFLVLYSDYCKWEGWELKDNKKKKSSILKIRRRAEAADITIWVVDTSQHLPTHSYKRISAVRHHSLSRKAASNGWNHSQFSSESPLFTWNSSIVNHHFRNIFVLWVRSKNYFTHHVNWLHMIGFFNPKGGKESVHCLYQVFQALI